MLVKIIMLSVGAHSILGNFDIADSACGQMKLKKMAKSRVLAELTHILMHL